jgi:hypothetical protein
LQEAAAAERRARDEAERTKAALHEAQSAMSLAVARHASAGQVAHEIALRAEVAMDRGDQAARAAVLAAREDASEAHEMAHAVTEQAKRLVALAHEDTVSFLARQQEAASREHAQVLALYSLERTTDEP